MPGAAAILGITPGCPASGSKAARIDASGLATIKGCLAGRVLRHPRGTDGAERPAPRVLRCPKSVADHVFPAPQGGILLHSGTRGRCCNLLEQVEVTMRWHDLRAYAVSLRIAQGFSIRASITCARRSSILMTMERYGRLFPSPDHQSAMAVAEAQMIG